MKTSRLLAALAVVVAVSVYRVTVEGDHVRQAIELCSDNDGLLSINQLPSVQPNYKCNNGVTFERYANSISKNTPD